MKLVIDVETTEVKDFHRPEWGTKVHLICAKVLGGADRVRCFFDPRADLTSASDGTLAEGVKFLEQAALLIGHNVVKFDAPVLRACLGANLPLERWHDTSLAASVRWPNLAEIDHARAKQSSTTLPSALIGNTGLAAWGHRIGKHKGGKPASWAVLTDEMIGYCMQDVEVCAELYQWMEAKFTPSEAITLEHQFAAVLAEQQHRGVLFNRKRADELLRDLLIRRAELDEQLHASIPAFDKVRITPKKRTRVEYQVTYNPGSRLHNYEALNRKYGWKPTKFTETGQPAVTELLLMSLSYPEAKLMAERQMVAKRISMLAEGEKGSWLKHLSEDGRIRGNINPMGTVTSRCSHSSPNLGNIPRVKSSKPLPKDYQEKLAYWGTRCRALFVAPPGYVLVGADASNLELRALAHYLAEWDDGRYAELVAQGDPHTANQLAGGFESREQAKKFLYVWLYGAGYQKIAKEMGCSVARAKQLATQFLACTPGLARLKKKTSIAHRERRYVEGLDGRRVPTRSDHAALNTLLQSFGAVAMKWAVVEAARQGTEGGQVLFIHDELQLECLEQHGPMVGAGLVRAIASATQRFNLRCPLAGDFKIGNDWSATH